MRKQKRKKLSKAEMLNRQIASWESKQDGAVVMLRKSAEMLLKLRRQRKRMLTRETDTLTAQPIEHPKVEAREREIADALVETAAVPLAELPELPETEIGKANTDAIPAVAKAKRTRKPKAPPGSTVAGLLVQDERAARMKALGFRKTK